MDMPEPKDRSHGAWIPSLAIAILFCALQFVIFAEFFINIKDDILTNKLHAEMTDQRIMLLMNDMDLVRHKVMVQQIQILPPPNTVPVSDTGSLRPLQPDVKSAPSETASPDEKETPPPIQLPSATPATPSANH